MKNLLGAILLSGSLLTVPVGAQSTDVVDLVDNVVTGCAAEIETFCGDVTLGEGRVLACLYAYSDRLSGQCEYALYDSAAQLERFISDLAYLVNECIDDLDRHCANVATGDGRLASCLLDNKDALEKRCAVAIDELQLEVVD